MRIALILLSILAFVFIGSISWSLISQSGGWNLGTATTKKTTDTSVESYWRNQIKTEEKLEKLTSLVEAIAEKNGTSTVVSNKGSGSETIIKLSGKFLERIMPAVTPALVENRWIFDLHIFDISTPYSSYEDAKLGIRMTATTLPYDTMIKNMRAVGPTVYSVNETKSFPFRSFYLNPPTSDTIVRLVIEMEGQSIALEIQKTKFNTVKDLLLWKTSTIKTTAQIAKPQTQTPPSTWSTNSTGSIRR